MVGKIVRVGSIGACVFAGAFSIVFGVPFLFAYYDGQNFSMSPQTMHLEPYVGQGPVTETLTIKPNAGWGLYSLYLPEDNDGGEYCQEWSGVEYESRCEKYDFESWANDDLLCNFLTFGEPDDGTWYVDVSDDTED